MTSAVKAAALDAGPAAAGAARRSRYRWVALAIGAYAQGAVTMFNTGLATIGPLLERHYHLDIVQVGSVFGAMPLGGLFTVVAWGLASDRWGERLILTVGLGTGSIVLAFASAATGYVMLLPAVFIAGMVTAASTIASARTVLTWFGASERGVALGIRQMAVPIGSAVGAAVLPPLATHLGVPAAFWFLALACGLAAAACVVGLRPAPVEYTGLAALPRRQVLADRNLWTLSLGVSLLILTQNFVLVYLVIFLTSYRHVPLTTAALVFLAVQLVAAVSRVAAGRLSDVIGSRVRPLRWVAIGTSVLLLATAVTADQPLWIMVAVVVAALVVNMNSASLAYAAAAELAGPGNVGLAVGVQTTVSFLASAAAPVLFGALIAGEGFRLAFAVSACFAAAAWLALRPALRAEGRR